MSGEGAAAAEVDGEDESDDGGQQQQKQTTSIAPSRLMMNARWHNRSSPGGGRRNHRIERLNLGRLEANMPPSPSDADPSENDDEYDENDPTLHHQYHNNINNNNNDSIIIGDDEDHYWQHFNGDVPTYCNDINNDDDLDDGSRGGLNHPNNINNNNINNNQNHHHKKGHNHHQKKNHLTNNKNASSSSSPSSSAAAGGSANFDPERYKTIVAFMVLTMGGFLNFLMLTIIHDLVPRGPILPDIVFMVIEQRRWAFFISDCSITLSLVLSFAFIILHRYRWIVIRRAFLLAGYLYFLRAAVMTVTFMPPAFKDKTRCLPQAERFDAWFILSRLKDYVLTLGMTASSDQFLCGDLMFSGHTMILTLSNLFLNRYTPKSLTLVRLLSSVVTVVGAVCLIVGGAHYTMDVLVSYWLSSHLFYGYHQVFEMSPRSSQRNTAMTELWWYYSSWWFEKNAPQGRLRNILEWPFSASTSSSSSSSNFLSGGVPLPAFLTGLIRNNSNNNNINGN